MSSHARIALLLLRIMLGWQFFYAGLSKILDPSWTSSGYLSNAGTFPDLFLWLSDPSRIAVVDILNEWGLLLIGVALILGLFVRVASWCGLALMILYWLPLLNFPYVEHSILIDNHIIYAIIFLLLIATRAGKYYGLDRFR